MESGPYTVTHGHITNISGVTKATLISVCSELRHISPFFTVTINEM